MESRKMWTRLQFCSWLIIYFLSESIVMGQHNSCEIPLKVQATTPVIILKSTTTEYKLFMPAGTTTSVIDTDLELACTGEDNYIRSTKTKFTVPAKTTHVTLQCKKNGNSPSAWHYGTSAVEVNDFQCSQTPKSQVKTKVGTCAIDKEIRNIGFTTSDGSHAKLFEFCYDETKKIGLYSKHIVNRYAFKYSTLRDPTFCNEGSCLEDNNKYNEIASQKTTFKKLFGDKQKYLSESQSLFFVVGHYAPCADFVYGYEQIATNYIVNTAPQYQALNNANWKRLEDKVRKKASSGVDLTVWTGSVDVLELKKSDTENTQVYLEQFCSRRKEQPDAKKQKTDPANVIVPKYFYKVITHGEEGIAYISLNNIVGPEVGATLSSFCTNICTDKNKYPTFTDTKRGLLICCKVDDFLKNNLVKKILPAMSNVKHVLELFT